MRLVVLFLSFWLVLAETSQAQWMGYIPLDAKGNMGVPPPPVPEGGRQPTYKTDDIPEVSTKELPVAVKRSVIMTYWKSTWCTVCPQMVPIVNRLWNEGWPIQPADTDQYRDIANQWKVTTLPTFITSYKNGSEIQRCEGVTTYEILLKMLKDAGATQVVRAESDKVAVKTARTQQTQPMYYMPQTEGSWNTMPWTGSSGYSGVRSGCPGGSCPGGRCPR